uniref:Uncharacterized protein n=1 Tax=Magnetococcus massalia (strain MO-1) TaxID=451514 RepID=A0A1S7LCG4_MAGMO|nr:protein of unknown function [Candidatus Magnetococcus massalia]
MSCTEITILTAYADLTRKFHEGWPEGGSRPPFMNFSD